MTREQIEKEFNIDIKTGIILNPGKFEGEMIYVPYFWDAAMNGLADEDNTMSEYDDTPVSLFNINDEDREQFPELKEIITVELWEDSNGFVRSWVD